MEALISGIDREIEIKGLVYGGFYLGLQLVGCLGRWMCYKVISVCLSESM